MQALLQRTYKEAIAKGDTACLSLDKCADDAREALSKLVVTLRAERATRSPRSAPFKPLSAPCAAVRTPAATSTRADVVMKTLHSRSGVTREAPSAPEVRPSAVGGAPPSSVSQRKCTVPPQGDKNAQPSHLETATSMWDAERTTPGVSARAGMWEKKLDRHNEPARPSLDRPTPQGNVLRRPTSPVAAPFAAPPPPAARRAQECAEKPPPPPVDPLGPATSERQVPPAEIAQSGMKRSTANVDQQTAKYGTASRGLSDVSSRSKSPTAVSLEQAASVRSRTMSEAERSQPIAFEAERSPSDASDLSSLASSALSQSDMEADQESASDCVPPPVFAAASAPTEGLDQRVSTQALEAPQKFSAAQQEAAPLKPVSVFKPPARATVPSPPDSLALPEENLLDSERSAPASPPRLGGKLGMWTSGGLRPGGALVRGLGSSGRVTSVLSTQETEGSPLRRTESFVSTPAPAVLSTPGEHSSVFATPGSVLGTPTDGAAYETPHPIRREQPASPMSTDVSLAIGDRVEAHGLVGAKRLNGLRGTVKTLKGDRFGVEFDGDADLKALKAVNLRRVEEDQSAHKSELDSSVSSEEDFPIHRAARTPARCLQDVRHTLPPHDPKDHRAPLSDTDEEEQRARMSEDESQLPNWCQHLSEVHESVRAQSLWGPGGSHELLTQAKLPPLCADQVFAEVSMLG